MSSKHLFLGGLAFAQVAGAQELHARAVFEQAADSVVVLVVGDSRGDPVGEGTGFFIDERVVVTNHHVIDDAHYVVARLRDGALCTAERVLASAAEHDLAVLELERGCAGPALSLSPEPATPGTEILVIGHPRGLDWSVSDGLVAARREVGSTEHIQITAPISPGNSGGPVLDASGHVTGVTSWFISTGQNLNFAVDRMYVRDLYKDAAVGAPRVDDAPPAEPLVVEREVPPLEQAFRDAATLVARGEHKAALVRVLPLSSDFHALSAPQREVLANAWAGYALAEVRRVVEQVGASVDNGPARLAVVRDGLASLRRIDERLDHSQARSRVRATITSLEAMERRLIAQMPRLERQQARLHRLERRRDTPVHGRLTTAAGVLLHQVDPYRVLAVDLHGSVGQRLLLGGGGRVAQGLTPDGPSHLRTWFPLHVGFLSRGLHLFVPAHWGAELIAAPLYDSAHRQVLWSWGGRARAGTDWLIHRSAGATLQAHVGFLDSKGWEGHDARQPTAFLGGVELGVVILP